MGACLCKSDKGLHGPPQPPVAELQSDTEEQPIVEGDNQPSNGTISEEKNRESYRIGALATSSLLGLVATVKEHITKPTAMAQGRVAHLIEWKGWDCGGGDGGAGIGWAGTGGRWTGAGASLQEDEQLYSHLTDEIKEARFAAGVAQQFALAEAAMIAWSSEDVPDGSKRSSARLQDADTRFLSQYLLNSKGTEVPPLLYGNNPDTSIDPSPLFHPLPPHAPWQPEAEQAQQKQGVSPADTSIRHADSISLSEDEVFYN